MYLYGLWEIFGIILKSLGVLRFIIFTVKKMKVITNTVLFRTESGDLMHSEEKLNLRFFCFMQKHFGETQINLNQKIQKKEKDIQELREAVASHKVRFEKSKWNKCKRKKTYSQTLS